MIRKLFVTASVVAMSASGIAAATAIAGSGVAGAKGVNPVRSPATRRVRSTSVARSLGGRHGRQPAKQTTAATLDSSDLDATTTCRGRQHHDEDHQVQRSPHGRRPSYVLASNRPKWSEPPGCTTASRQGEVLRPGLELRRFGCERHRDGAEEGHRFDDSGTDVDLDPDSATAVDPSGACGGSDTSGFQIKGTVKKSYPARPSPTWCA